MNPLTVYSEKLVNRAEAIVLTMMVFAAAILNWYEFFEAPPPLDGLMEVTFLAIAGLLLLDNASRRVAINVETRMLTINIDLFDALLSKNVHDISNCTWVRCRLAGRSYDALLIEVGTDGFQTTEIATLPNGERQNLLEADRICAEIAAALGLINKGFKGVA